PRALSPDGKLLGLVDYGDKRAQVIEVETGRILFTINHNHKAPVQRMRFILSTRQLIIMDDEGPPSIWDLDTGKLSFVLEDAVRNLILAPDKRHLVGIFRGYVTSYDIQTGNRLKPNQAQASVRPIRTSDLSVFAFSPDGTRFATSDHPNLLT